MRFAILPGLGLLLALGGCGDNPLPSFNMSSAPTAPGDSLTIRRVMGDDVSAEPVGNDMALGWIEPEAPRSTLGNPDEALRNVPEYRPIPRPGIERDTRLNLAPVPSYTPPAPIAPANGALRSGQVLSVPGGAPATLGAGAGTSTYTRPGAAGGVVVDTGPGSATLLGSDGTVRVVPR